MDTKIIMISNIKGGVGKTSSVAALGDVLARKMGKNVLLIDADPQGSLSHQFGYDPDENAIENTFDAFLMGEYKARKDGKGNESKPSFYFNEAVLKKPRSSIDGKYKTLQIMCSSSALQAVYNTFNSDSTDAASIIRRFLFWLKDNKMFDYVLIDTFPTMSSALWQFLLGSDYLMIPLPPEQEAMIGAERLLTIFNTAIDSKSDFIYKDLQFLGFFFCNIAQKGRADKLYRQNKGEFWDEETFFESIVPKSTAVINAQNRCAPVTAVYPNSPAALGYINLAKEMEIRIQKMEEEQRG